MTARLTDDEIAELRHLHAIATDRALSAFTRSNALEKLINKVTWHDLARLLDEIEERRRAEQRLLGVDWAVKGAELSVRIERKDGGA